MPDATAPSKDQSAGMDSQGRLRTAAQAADDQAGGAKPGYGGTPHPSAAAAPAAKPPGPSIHPVAKGVYGAPLGSTILK